MDSGQSCNHLTDEELHAELELVSETRADATWLIQECMRREQSIPPRRYMFAESLTGVPLGTLDRYK